jgi:predicted DCC family thiol-disulfide oxidoreductase YuxK
MDGQRLVVWYNTRCPVCDAGIDRQRNKLIAAVQAGRISFRDINESPRRSRPTARRSTTSGAVCTQPMKPGG